MEVKAWEDLTPEEQEERWAEARKAQDRISRQRSIKKLRRTAGGAASDQAAARDELRQLIYDQRSAASPLTEEAELRRIAANTGRAQRLARALIACKALERMGEL
jgi:hypothetical protein